MLATVDGRGRGHEAGGIDLLLVCTGNICRSPMAEGLLGHRLKTCGIDAHVQSAGLLTDGAPASGNGIAVLRDDYGIDVRGHRSRLLDVSMVESADLIVAMARAHVHTVAREQPEAFGRAFTLKELVRRASEIGIRGSDDALASWLARLHDGRRLEDLRGVSPADDVADPIGQDTDVYRSTAAELHQLIERLVDAVWGHDPRTRAQPA